MILTEDSPVVQKYKFKYIKKVGAELEGGWENKPTYHLATDVSVRCGGNFLGELRTDPKDNLVDIFREVMAKYPDDMDSSCGFHVHVSLSPKYHAKLGTKEYFDYFLTRMGELGEKLKKSSVKSDISRFMERLSGKNTYCARTFDPVGQIRRGTDRRTMLNFCPHKEHGTIENRLFPMFEHASNARMAIFEYVDSIETFLHKNRGLDKYTLSVEIPFDGKELKIKEE